MLYEVITRRGPSSPRILTTEHRRVTEQATIRCRITSYNVCYTKLLRLAQGELYAGDPVFVERYLDWINTATPEDVRQVARMWTRQISTDAAPCGWPPPTTISRCSDCCWPTARNNFV